MGEETGDADGGDSNWPPWKEVAGVVEGREKGDAEAAVGHGVEEAVAGCRQKELGPQGE